MSKTLPQDEGAKERRKGCVERVFTLLQVDHTYLADLPGSWQANSSNQQLDKVVISIDEFSRLILNYYPRPRELYTDNGKAFGSLPTEENTDA